MSKAQEKYLEEYEKYKNINITEDTYILRDTSIKYNILKIDKDNQTALVETVHSGIQRNKTLHWCRKNLISLEE